KKWKISFAEEKRTSIKPITCSFSIGMTHRIGNLLILGPKTPAMTRSGLFFSKALAISNPCLSALGSAATMNKSILLKDTLITSLLHFQKYEGVSHVLYIQQMD